MKLAFLNDVPMGQAGSGGVEHHVAQLAGALRAAGHEVMIITRQDKGLPEERRQGEYRIPDLDAPPLRKRPVRNWRDQRRALGRLGAMLRDFRPDVIHVHNLLTPWVLRELRPYAPVVKSIHDCRPFCVKPRPAVASRLIGRSETFCDITLGLRCFGRCYLTSGADWQERLEAWTLLPAHLQALRAVTQCSRIVVYSRYLQQLALRVIADASKVHLVPLFTDLESSAEKTAPPGSLPAVLFAGRLSREKGVHHLFSALDLTRTRAYELLLAGDGPSRADVERRIAARLSPPRVTLLGYVERDKLRQLYEKAALVVFPSIGSEGCGLTGLEALACGTPVVGYDVGGVREWLIHEQTGLLVRRGDVAGLAAGMERLLTEPGLRNRLGEQGRALVREKFQKSRHVQALLAIYAGAVAA